MPPRIKSAEGIVIIIDVGPAVRASTDTTFYSQAKRCLINILQRKIFAEKCSDLVGIVLFGTDDTKNKLATDEQYQHVYVLQNPKLVDWEMISMVEHLPRGNYQADWLDAVIVAMDLLHNADDDTYSNKKIVLMTDFNTEFSDDQTDTIIGGLKRMDIDLSVIGPSVEDSDDNIVPNNSQPGTSNGTHKSDSSKLNWNGKIKTPQQLAGESLIHRILSEVDGMIYSFDEAIPQLIFFEKKSQSSANWNAQLTIGNNLRIPIIGKIKIKPSTARTWKKVYAADENAAIIAETSYYRPNEERTMVEECDIISGYRYGSTLIPFGDEDNQLKYECGATGAELSVLGFTRSSYVPLDLRAGDQVLVVTARDFDENAAVALSAIIQGLKELDMVAVTRRVYRKKLNPVLGALFPDITENYECLIWVALPFQEDVRNFAFPSLNKTQDRISDEQRQAVDELIDAMDLQANESDDEEFDPTSVVNPQLQHYFNCLTQRAISPDEPVPAPQQHVLDILNPREAQQDAVNLIMPKIKTLFPTKRKIKEKISKADMFKNANMDTNQASTSNAVDGKVSSSDLIGGTVTKITSVSPVQDFLALLMGDQPNYNNICQQMEDVIHQFIDRLSSVSAADQIIVDKILGAMKAFRKEALALDPTPYNGLLRRLKPTVVTRKLDQLWLMITQDNLGLITAEETLKSTFTAEDAQEFLRMTSEEEAAPPENPPEVDYDDMLDEL